MENSGSDEPISDDERPEGIFLEETSGYMELSLAVLASIHCILSLSMLVSYYRLKVCL